MYSTTIRFSLVKSMDAIYEEKDEEINLLHVIEPSQPYQHNEKSTKFSCNSWIVPSFRMINNLQRSQVESTQL